MDNVLVTGVTGQIGHYIAALLAGRGVRVYGLVRQTTSQRHTPVAELPYIPVAGDLLDEFSMLSVLEELRPTRIFNFAAQSFIPSSWTQPILTAQYTAMGVVRLLEAARRAVPHCRILQAGSSELFADSGVTPQDERTPIAPVNPYGIAKAFAYHTVLAYRRRYGVFATNAVFFTNESPRRSPDFIFRKVTRSVAEILAGKRKEFSIGNLDAVRDWGFAPEYAAIAVSLLEHDVADEFVVATGEGHSVRELVQCACGLVGLDWERCVRVESGLVRPNEPAPPVGNTSKLKSQLGIHVNVTFETLVRVMLAHDLQLQGLKPPFSTPALSPVLAQLTAAG